MLSVEEVQNTLSKDQIEKLKEIFRDHKDVKTLSEIKTELKK